MSDYGFVDRLLHKMALGSTSVAEASFSIDQTLARGHADVTERRHVFVSGLARAGTTILMRRIYDSGAFRSLTYADMPFLLAPNLWRLLRGGRTRYQPRVERAHGDGIEVGADSPESLDEVFWRIFIGEAYIKPNRLLPHRPDTELLERYRAYVGAILGKSGPSLYLSKNNNNILRLESLQRAFPNSVIVIPFRAPIDQAMSLLKQHLRFQEMHDKDRFTKDYMGWLVHHEFGSDHRPFATHPVSEFESEKLAYWVEQWVGVYQWVLSTAPKNVIFICYEELCANPDIWNRLSEFLDIQTENRNELEFICRKPSNEMADLPEHLREKAENLYDHLQFTASKPWTIN